MFGIGTAEILIVLVVGLFLFGSKLPSIARSLGLALGEFRKEASGLTDGLLDKGR